MQDITGSRSNTAVKTVPRRLVCHVSRLDKNTAAEELVVILNVAGTKTPSCSALRHSMSRVMLATNQFSTIVIHGLKVRNSASGLSTISLIISSFNLHGINNGRGFLETHCNTCDIIAVQKH